MNAIPLVKLDASPVKGRRNGTLSFLFLKCANLEADANSHPDGKSPSECYNTPLLISSTRGQFEDAVTVIH